MTDQEPEYLKTIQRDRQIVTRVLDRSHDTLGHPTGHQLKNGTIPEAQATYQYSATDGRLATVADGTHTFTYSYLANSNLLATLTGPAHTVENTYATDRDILLSKENQVGTTTISKYQYTVNALGQRTAASQTGTAFPAATGWNWGYDSLGQVTTAENLTNPANHRSYGYDTIGNRKKSADSLTLPGSDNYTANSLNQYTAIGTLAPLHDDNGNMTSGQLPTGTAGLVWDAENRLTTAAITGGATVHYLYDAQSRRIARVAGTATTLYLYDGWNPIAEYAGTTLIKGYLWGMDLSGSMQGAGGVGGLLMVTVGSAGSADRYFPTYDGNGNVSEYLDSTGAIQAHYEYDPFGNITMATGPKAADFTHRFSTKPLDATTGLYYYGYRYYDPLTGRWPSRDPIGEEGGINLYSFGGNGPISGVDVLGGYWSDENSWWNSVGRAVQNELDNVRRGLEDTVESGKSKAAEVINGFLEKAAQGDLKVSWRRSQKAILWKSRGAIDIEISSSFGYGVNVDHGSIDSNIIRGELFVFGTLEGRFKSQRIPQLGGAKVIVKAGGQAKLSRGYCYDKALRKAYLESEPEGSLSLGIGAGLRWETGWYGNSFLNDYWATNHYVEGIVNIKWKWKLPSMEYDGFAWGAYVRGVTEKQQQGSWGNGTWVGVTEHFRWSYGDNIDF